MAGQWVDMNEFQRRVAAEDLDPGTNQPLNANTYAIERKRELPRRAPTLSERVRRVRPPQEYRTEIIELGPLLKYEFTLGDDTLNIGVPNSTEYSFNNNITIVKTGDGPHPWSVAVPAEDGMGHNVLFLKKVRITPISRPRSMTEDPGLPEGGSRLNHKTRRAQRRRRNLKHRQLRKLTTRRR